MLIVLIWDQAAFADELMRDVKLVRALISCISARNSAALKVVSAKALASMADTSKLLTLRAQTVAASLKFGAEEGQLYRIGTFPNCTAPLRYD